jgi:hypothetical protein
MKIPSRGANGEKPLVGWPEISRYLEISEDTAQRWANGGRLPQWASYPLPMRLIGDHPYTYPSQLEIWLEQQDMPYIPGRRLRVGAVRCGVGPSTEPKTR